MSIDEEWSNFLDNSEDINIINKESKVYIKDNNLIPKCSDIYISTKTKIIYLNIDSLLSELIIIPPPKLFFKPPI